MNQAIQTATRAHIAALAAIHAAAFPPSDAWSRDAITLQLDLPGVFGLIDQRGGMLLARIVTDEAEILTLAVATAKRRQGVGTSLLRTAKAEIAARKAAQQKTQTGQ